MILLPYLRIDDGVQCTEAINNARTLAHIARPVAPRPAAVWAINDTAGCATHQCAEFNTADYTYPTDWEGNPAPWADPAIPASGEFFGLLLDADGMTLEPSWSNRRRGDSVYDAADYRPRLLTITGTIIASSARGTAYGQEWLTRQFLGRNCRPGRSGTFNARVLKHCPDPAAAEFAGWEPYVPQMMQQAMWLNPDTGEIVGGATWGIDFGMPVYWDIVRPVVPGTDPCDDVTMAVPLAPAEQPGPLPDIGWRDLYRCRFLYLEDLDDEPMLTCEGKRVVIVCEVLGEGTWWADDERWSHWTLLQRAFDRDTARPIDWTAYQPEIIEPCGSCGLPCRCDTTPTVELAPIVLAGCYRQPLVEVSLSTLTPTLPWSIEAGIVLDITGGQFGVENVSVKIYDALDGVPDPATVLGCRVYSQRTPCAEAQIAGIPAGATLSIDGRRKRVTLRCPGKDDRAAEDMVVGPDGLPFEHPRLSCGQRFWVVISADYYNFSEDTEVRVHYVPVEVS